MKDLPKLILAMFLVLPNAAGLAAEPQPPQPAAPAPTRPATTTAYLGVEVGTLPPALAVQLPAAVPKGQGVLISRHEAGLAHATILGATGLRGHDARLAQRPVDALIALYNGNQKRQLLRGSKCGDRDVPVVRLDREL